MHRSALPVLLTASALTLAACGGTDDSGDDGVSVVASFYPAQYLAERVGGDLVEVSTLTSPGVEAHDLELTARQIGELRDADVLVYLEHFQAAVDQAVEQADRDAGTTVDLAEGVELLEESDDGHDHAHEEEGHDDHAHEEEGHDDHDHGEEGHEEDQAHEEDGHDHDHGGVDPHLWLDPANLEPAATAIADALSDADPDNADTYRANADELVGDLTTLDEEFENGLAQCERREFVTSHAAFSYLAHAYDLTQVPIAGIDPGTEPSSAQLAEITDLVQEEGITTIFTETLVSPALAETIARETGARTATLDPIEGLTDETADADYLSLMRDNLAALQEANTCR
ncbi:zinc ABC transporter substrate-binding protein [Aeromicrobium sp. YIM 150415]|uniref:metal ABC transporter substrate-binding protein n=1 Tax=Aeromicrobium sp. YIM 150415 TaxID=2803912 RepID=UPI00196281D2|nr:metal ABC transporter substrate-binding protein [Aeromicrobium sp. YIM 150415]MBM9462809.1 zinc ABC transporter substrate-binding protein [Aeromicrobium sp. YIM 150415]